MTDSSNDLLIEKRGHALWLTINREARRNAMSPAVLAGIRAGIDHAQADRAVRVIVLTGAGEKAFCAGADLAKGSGSFQYDPSIPHLDYADLLRHAWKCVLPMIARPTFGFSWRYALSESYTSCSTNGFASMDVRRVFVWLSN